MKVLLIDSRRDPVGESFTLCWKSQTPRRVSLHLSGKTPREIATLERIAKELQDILPTEDEHGVRFDLHDETRPDGHGGMKLTGKRYGSLVFHLAPTS